MESTLEVSDRCLRLHEFTSLEKEDRLILRPCTDRTDDGFFDLCISFADLPSDVEIGSPTSELVD